MKLISITVLVLLCVADTTFAQGKKIWANSFLNQAAPKLEVETWLTKVPETKGKFVMVDFWATWCKPSQDEIQFLNRVHKKYGDKLVVIGLSEETETKIRQMTEPKIDYFLAIDTQARMKKGVGVIGIPHALIMDPKGIVRWEGYTLLPNHELKDTEIDNILSRFGT